MTVDLTSADADSTQIFDSPAVDAALDTIKSVLIYLRRRAAESTSSSSYT